MSMWSVHIWSIWTCGVVVDHVFDRFNFGQGSFGRCSLFGWDICSLAPEVLFNLELSRIVIRSSELFGPLISWSTTEIIRPLEVDVINSVRGDHFRTFASTTFRASTFDHFCNLPFLHYFGCLKYRLLVDQPDFQGSSTSFRTDLFSFDNEVTKLWEVNSSPWVKWMNLHYIKGRGLDNTETKLGDSIGWKVMLRARAKIRRCVQLRPNGMMMWMGEGEKGESEKYLRHH